MSPEVETAIRVDAKFLKSPIARSKSSSIFTLFVDETLKRDDWIISTRSFLTLKECSVLNLSANFLMTVCCSA